jgi:hypothetical protein
MDRSGGYAVGPVLFRYGLGLKAATSQPFVRSFGTADDEPFQALTRGRHLSAFALAGSFRRSERSFLSRKVTRVPEIR